MRILIGITGASGSVYGIRLIEELIKNDHEVHLIISEEAKKIIRHETGYNTTCIVRKVHRSYRNNDLTSPPASGSFMLDSMIIVPCSTRTLSSIAHGHSDTLISRAASCFLKEGRKLIIVVRETPLDLPSLRNMLTAKEAGAVILPAMPGFYHKPEKIEDLVDFIVGKILDQLQIKHDLFKRWS
ncbi:MAG: UbiX family flavin prenyltransferase [Candidatus Thermoplasmatota archaeon]